MTPDWMSSNSDDLNHKWNESFLNRSKVHPSALEHAVHVEAPNKVPGILSGNNGSFGVEPTEGKNGSDVPQKQCQWNENHSNQNHVLVAELCANFEVATSVSLTDQRAECSGRSKRKCNRDKHVDVINHSNGCQHLVVTQLAGVHDGDLPDDIGQKEREEGGNNQLNDLCNEIPSFLVRFLLFHLLMKDHRSGITHISEDVLIRSKLENR